MFRRLLTLATFWFAALVSAGAQTVLLDGKPIPVDATAVDGRHYLDAAPIMEALGNTHTFLDGVLEVVRQPDNAVFTLAVEDGLVSVGGKPLGRLAVFGDVGEGKLHLTPNALSVLTGLKVDYDEETDTYELELDGRLKTATGFELFVNGAPLLSPSPDARSVGAVLLLPLLPIAEELGSTVTVQDGGATVRVDRVQDSASFQLDLQTGLVSFRGHPVGIVPDMGYADVVNLLLPKAAVETLTGTRVAVVAGTSRIEIDLDSRLQDTVAPGRGVLEDAQTTPFTPETLQFELGPRALNRAEGDFRVRGFNGRARVEWPDLPGRLAEAEPSWLSLDFAHVGGVRGSLGDVAPRNRELSGVGAGRVRGLALERTRETGRLSAVAGMPRTGSRKVGDDQFRPTFGGVVAGARWADEDGWEAGIGIRHDAVTDEQRVVLSAISRRLGQPLGRPGAFSWTAEADAGYFSRGGVDARAALSARQPIGENVSVDASVRYSGGAFQTATLGRRDLERLEELQRGNDVEDPLGPEFSRKGLARVDASIGVNWSDEQVGWLRHPAASLRAESSHVGDRVRDRVSAGAGAVLGHSDIGINANWSHYSTRGGDDAGSSLVLQARRSFEHADAKISYALTRDSESTRKVLTATLTGDPVGIRLPQGASLAVGPSATGSLVDGQGTLRAGVRAHVDSGEVFGPRNRVTANLGILNSVSTRGRHRVDEYLSVNVLRDVALGDNMALGLGLNSNLRGDVDIGLRLRGRFDFNPKRRLRKTRPESGVLSGTVFLDANRNGVRDADEMAAPGVKLSLQNTPWTLRTDAGGNFTVQNLPMGLYEVRVDGRTLPLGYAQSEDAPRRATVGDGRVTDMHIPIVARGQIRGSVFRDIDGDGVYARGDMRPEDVKLTLVSSTGEKWSVHTTAFGQFAFDDLAADTYRITSDGRELVTLDLADHDRLLAKVRVPLPPDPLEHQAGAGAPVATP